MYRHCFNLTKFILITALFFYYSAYAGYLKVVVDNQTKKMVTATLTHAKSGRDETCYDAINTGIHQICTAMFPKGMLLTTTPDRDIINSGPAQGFIEIRVSGDTFSLYQYRFDAMIDEGKRIGVWHPLKIYRDDKSIEITNTIDYSKCSEPTYDHDDACNRTLKVKIK